MLNQLPIYMIQCLLITIIAECIIARIFKIEIKDLIIVLLVNVLTNPLLVSISFSTGIFFGNIYRIIVTIILEILVVFTEGFIYKKILFEKKFNPYTLSLILNISSYIVGWIINYIFYWRRSLWTKKH